MKKPETELFDEGRLRRALRLETGEMPARLNVAALIARAETWRPEHVAASFASALVAGGAGALLVAAGIVAFTTVAPALASDLWSAGLRTFADVAVWASWPLSVAQDPTIPMAAIAALAVAVAFEYTQRRERQRAVTTS